MQALDIRRTHSPYYTSEQPVFPDSMEIASPFYLQNIRNWHWEVSVKVYTLQYYLAANAHFEIAGKTYLISRGSSFLLRPGDKVKGYTLDNQPLTVFGSHFNAIPDTFPSEETLHTSIQEIALVEALTELAVRNRRQGVGDSLAMKQVDAAIHSIYYLFCSNYRQGPTTSLQRRVEALLERIQADVSADWSVDVMCKELNISRSQLNRWFNKLTGLSPTRYVIHQRIGQAAQRITMSSLTLQQIADELGYRDVHFFTRQFQKTMGFPPSSLRKPMQQ